METSKTAEQVAKTISKQLGGNRFNAMVGAYNHAYGTDDKGNDFLSVRFKGSRKANYLKVTLNVMDTYDIDFGKLTKKGYKLVSGSFGIYDDMLQSSFRETTGLNTSL